MANFFERIARKVTRGISKGAKVIKSIGKRVVPAGLKMVGDLGQTALAAIAPEKELRELNDDQKKFSKELLNALPPNVRKFVGSSWLLQPGREFLSNQQLALDIALGNKELTVANAIKLFPVFATINGMLNIAEDFPDRRKKAVRKRMLKEVKQMLESWFNALPVLFGLAHADLHAPRK